MTKKIMLAANAERQDGEQHHPPDQEENRERSRERHDGGKNKTGTLDGVSTLAGYADTSSHGQVRFVISLATNDGELRFRVLRAIASGLQPRVEH